MCPTLPLFILNLKCWFSLIREVDTVLVFQKISCSHFCKWSHSVRNKISLGSLRIVTIYIQQKTFLERAKLCGNWYCILNKEIRTDLRVLQLTHVMNECVLPSKEQLELLSGSHTGWIQNASLIYKTWVTWDSLEIGKIFLLRKYRGLKMWLYICAHDRTTMSSPASASGKESACNAGNSGLIPGSGRSRRVWQPTPEFFPGESHGQRSLGVYNP